MHAHVTTYQLGASEERTYDDIERAAQFGEPITDRTARTIASWWHSPAPNSRNITRLSHGLPFDTEELAEEIAREITDHIERDALSTWLDRLETSLSEVDDRPKAREDHQ